MLENSLKIGKKVEKKIIINLSIVDIEREILRKEIIGFLKRK